MDEMTNHVFQTELTLRGIPKELDDAAMRTVEAYQRDELPVDTMHEILWPIRRAFEQITNAHRYVTYIAEDLGVELHKGPETFLELLGTDAIGRLPPSS